MIELLAQTTQGDASWRHFTASEWVLIIGAIVAGATAMLKLWLDNRATNAAMRNLAGAVRDVSTDAKGNPMPNVSPGTLPTLDKIEGGGTGNGGVEDNDPTKP
jgi:hypothetical protein